MTKGDWFVCVDLQDAYFHVPIALHHRTFLHFSFLGHVYQFKVLLFELSLASWVFTRCVNPALSPLWTRGLWILPYLDNWLVCAPTEELAHDSNMLLSHVWRLGLVVNEKVLSDSGTVNYFYRADFRLCCNVGERPTYFGSLHVSAQECWYDMHCF